MLIDDITIILKAGKGGKGAVTFKNTAHQPMGGPDGGNGGHGGSVYIQGTSDLSALSQFRYKKVWSAEEGVAGGRNNLYGRNGKDLVIKVPLGTQVTEVETGISYEVLSEKTNLILAKGGRGGRGNNEFKSATNQTPHYAEPGDDGEEKEVHLELRLIADIGLIGLPNAGKSSLLATLTNAAPKIADYPFTTLEPNLGVMGGIILADIPGLIEGASSGKGLGTKFLKHIEKTKLLVHCIDAASENPLESYQTIRKELEGFDEKLAKKTEIILLTKTDMVDSKEITKLEKQLKKVANIILSVSILDDKLVENLQNRLVELVRSSKSSVV